MASSLIPVRAALYAGCQSLFSPTQTPPVTVFYGPPLVEVPNYWVSISTSSTTEEWATLRPQTPTEETVDVDVVFAAHYGHDQMSVTASAAELADTFRTWLRSNPTLGLTPLQSRNAHVVRSELQESDDEDLVLSGYFTWLTLTVQTHARLSN